MAWNPQGTMDTSRYISMCTDRDTVFEAGQYLTGDGGWVCYPQGMRDKSMGVTLVILNPVILPGFDTMCVLYADIVPPAKACTAFECICVRVSEYIMSESSVSEYSLADSRVSESSVSEYSL